MNTLIVYGTRKGCTRLCAEKLQQLIHHCEIVDVRDLKSPQWDSYDSLIFGSSIWAGKVHRKIGTLLREHHAQVSEKRIGLFLCSGDSDPNYFSANYPQELLDRATIISSFGGKLDIQDYSPIMRWILRRRVGITESYNRINGQAIQDFAKVFTEGASE